MSRSKTYGLVLALLATAAVSGCTKSDATGPSEAPAASFTEAQGANN